MTTIVIKGHGVYSDIVFNFQYPLPQWFGSQYAETCMGWSVRQYLLVTLLVLHRGYHDHRQANCDCAHLTTVEVINGIEYWDYDT